MLHSNFRSAFAYLVAGGAVLAVVDAAALGARRQTHALCFN